MDGFVGNSFQPGQDSTEMQKESWNAFGATDAKINAANKENDIKRKNKTYMQNRDVEIAEGSYQGRDSSGACDLPLVSMKKLLGLWP